MSQELHYTSVPRGLKPGARGFCTVAHTAGLSQALLERLEGLSGYRPRFKPNDPKEAINPVVWSHLRLTGTGPAVTVISRVGSAGLDYTGRENKHAHHVVLDPGERAAGGPAWLLSQPEFIQTSWPGAPRVLPTGPAVPTGDRPPTICRAWESQAGDAGWAGVVAESFLADPKRPVVVIYDPGADILSLFAEAIALLPPDRRWEATFSTYFTGLAPGVSCGWRGVLRDSPEERQARSNPDSLIIDLGRPARASQVSVLVNQARTGVRPAPVRPTPLPKLPQMPAPWPLQEEVVAPSLSVATPTPPSLADDFFIATPPPRPRTRRSGAGVPPRSGVRSAWAIVAAVSVLVLGLAIVGTGVAISLRGKPRPLDIEIARQTDVPKADVIVSPKTGTTVPETKSEKASTPETPAVKPNATLISSDAGAGKPNAPGAIANIVPPATPDEKSATPKPPDKPSPTPTSVKDNPYTEKLPKNEGDAKSEGKMDPPSQEKATPVDKGPPTLGFFKIPLLIDHTNGGPLPSIKADGPVTDLLLVGGEDPMLKPYVFKIAKNVDKPGHFDVKEVTNERLVGTFQVKGSNISFDWELSPDVTENLKNSFFDCILVAILEDGTRSYYWLRYLQMKPLPVPLREWPKDVFHSPDKKPRADAWEIDVTWCGDDSVGKLNRAWTKRALSLNKLTLTPADGKPLDFRREGTGKFEFVAANGPPPAKVSITLSEASPGDLRFTFSPKPLTDRQQTDFRSDIKQRQTYEIDVNEGRILSTQNFKAEVADLRIRERSADEEDQWKTTLQSILEARVEAVVTFKAGDMEFALPTLKSGDSK